MNATGYKFLQEFLKQRSGLVLADDKQYLIESRLMPIARKANLDSVDTLAAKIKTDPRGSLAGQVIEAMTTNESFFFRDKTPFDNFTDVMLPELMEKRRMQKKLRIWCAAASTGQEPYSLGICLKELGAKASGWSFEMIGTDLSTQVLEKAKSGVYTQFEVQRGLPIQLLLKYFTQEGELWRINPDMRAMIQYRVLNLLDSYTSLGKFDVVFCRNVLIYFDQATKIDILERIAKQMPEDGYLVLGAAETVVGLTDRFKPVAGTRGLYSLAPASSDKSEPRPLRAISGGRI
ncbi:CheR family methyltransferase [Coralliovum pocilloporae]|uniref:CheR family methyltransferase n=1 Tax=Coralliovum pocilloporae TaxID=3066369 RepID=UPI0033071889